MNTNLMGGQYPMSKILVKCRNIHIGDILFASSVAKKLKEETPSSEVHFDIDYLQPIELLNNNPYIDKVFFKESDSDYTKTYNIIESGYTIDPYKSTPSQFQKMCDVKSFDDTFEIFTSQHLDYSIEKSMNELVQINEWKDDYIKVGYQMDWDQKSFLFTEEEYYRAEGGEDGTGYGTGKRNIYDIINCMEVHPKIVLLALGIDDKVSKRFPTINSTSKFTFTASLIKNCDYVIGAEGCLTNISAALGVSTIITTDYIYQMFGPKGVMWQQNKKEKTALETRQPFLGPLSYFPTGSHTHLDPFLNDLQVGDQILEIICNGR